MRKHKWLLSYTALWALVSAFWILCAYVSGRTLLWHGDSYYQFYTALSYTGKAVRSLLSGNGFKMVDLSLGHGLDTVGMLSFYGLTNPFYWIGALFTGKGLEIYYHALLLFYIWAAGALFGRFLRVTGIHKGNSRVLIMGAVMFAFCGYNTAGLLKFPFFAPGVLGLILILLAVERYLKTGKWLCATLSVFLTVIANYYLAYQTLLLCAGYVLLRLFGLIKTNGVRKAARKGFALLFSCGAGVLLSAVILLPALDSILLSGRVSTEAGATASLLYYPLSYYRDIISGFISPYSYAGFWTQVSFVPPVLLGIFALFSEKGHRSVKIGFLLTLLMVLMPFFGKLMNGGGYPANRWSYGFAFACCVCASRGLSVLIDAPAPKRRNITLFSLIFALIALALSVMIPGSGAEEAEQLPGFLPVSTQLLTAAAGLCALAFCALLIWNKGLLPAVTGKRLLIAALVCGAAYSMGYGALMLTSSDWYGKDIDKAIKNDAVTAAVQIEDDYAIRVDTGFSRDAHSSITGYRGNGYYWSTVPGSIPQALIRLGCPGLRWTFLFNGYENDPFLEAVAAVGSAVRTDGSNDGLPYGFSATDKAQVYKNEYALPLGIFFTETLSEDDWNALSPLDKRRALLSRAVTGTETSLASAPGGLSPLPFTLEAESGLEASAKLIKGEAGKCVSISFDAPADTLIYILFDKPVLSGRNDEVYSDMLLKTADGSVSDICLSNPLSKYAYPQECIFVYAGTGADGAETVYLRPEQSLSLALDGIEIYALPVKEYTDLVEEARTRGVWAPEIANNRISGSFKCDKSGIMQLSVPFSSGWKASVNGKESPLFACGAGYMGLKLEPGENKIVLDYTTPFLREGLIVSLITLAAVVICVFLERRKPVTHCEQRM